MILILVIFAGGLAIIGLLLGARWFVTEEWRQSLVAYELRLPRGLTADMLTAWLGTLAASTRRSPVALEVVATHNGISHYLLVPKSTSTGVLSQLRSGLPGVRVEEAPDFFSAEPHVRLAAEFRLTNASHPLAHRRAESSTTALLSVLHPCARGEVVRIQWILSGARTSMPVGDVSAEDKRALKEKQAAPLFNAAGRVAISTPTMGRAVTLLDRLANGFRVLDTPGIKVVRRLLPANLVAARVQQRRLPLAEWPCLINTQEAAGLLGLPFADVQVPGLSLGTARQLAPAVGMPSKGVVLAMSNFSGMQDRPLALKTTDRLRHTWVLGPTGVGKSTLLGSMIKTDIDAGRGLVVLDPKGDLVADVLDRVPDHRRADVLVVDASAVDRPVGVNVLRSSSNELQRELMVDALTHTMSSLWRSSWGPRTSDVIRAGLLTLVATRAADGSPFTVVELPELLLNPRFRSFVLGQSSVPAAVRPFWTEYEQKSDADRAQVIGPSLNKLRQFTTRSSLRLMLGQSHGVDLRDVFTKRQIVLVPLAKGVLGQDTAALIGSLVVAHLFQATLERISVPPERRHPVMIYLDEFQNFVRLPVDLSDMLAEARGYGTGYVLSHQFLGQLTDDVKAAVLGTVRTQIAFQLKRPDAVALAPEFAPLKAEELQGLPAYEIAMRPCVGGATGSTVTGRTLPLPDATCDGSRLARESRGRFGVARADVEAALQARIGTGTTPGIGRTRRGAA